MSKTKPDKTTSENNTTESGFINIVEEKTCVGVVESFGKLPSKEQGKEFVFIQFEDGRKLAIGSSLMNLIHVAHNTPEIGFDVGSEIKVHYVKTTKTKKGYNVNVMQLFVNNVEVKPAEIDKDQFFEFIGSGLPFD